MNSTGKRESEIQQPIKFHRGIIRIKHYRFQPHGFPFEQKTGPKIANMVSARIPMNSFRFVSGHFL